MSKPNWRPSASIEMIKQRAVLLAGIRHFFSERQVMEVETPLLARYSVTDPHMGVISTDNPLANPQGNFPAEHLLVEQQRFYLQTSPEYAMKRLLAAGSGPIYQIGKAFRKEEQGSRHNPEFTLLEWYRPGFDHFQLMAEMEALLAPLLCCPQPFLQMSYRQVFQQYLAIDPHKISCNELKQVARGRLDIQMQSSDPDDWLNLLMAECIEPQLGFEAPVFIYHYPASQAALAKIAEDEQQEPVARRFELYVKGVELANGYHELTDKNEQQKRFMRDQQCRKEKGLAVMESDQYLLAAMAEGLPECAGVALGIDRLLMVQQGVSAISDILAFPINRV